MPKILIGKVVRSSWIPSYMCTKVDLPILSKTHLPYFTHWIEVRRALLCQMKQRETPFMLGLMPGSPQRLVPGRGSSCHRDEPHDMKEMCSVVCRCSEANTSALEGHMERVITVIEASSNLNFGRPASQGCSFITVSYQLSH